jgi:hypothetical protein
MSGKAKLKRLAEVSNLILETKLMALEKAARARQYSLDRLAEINKPFAPSNLPLVAAAEVAIRYELWADQRRSEINTVLARQTAEWDEARLEAARAFGRNQVLGKLRDRPLPDQLS